MTRKTLTTLAFRSVACACIALAAGCGSTQSRDVNVEATTCACGMQKCEGGACKKDALHDKQCAEGCTKDCCAADK